MQTREHGDLDLAVEARHREALVNSLQGNGFTRLGEVGATAWNFLLAHPDGAVVDLHVIVFDAAGNGVLGLRLPGAGPVACPKTARKDNVARYVTATDGPTRRTARSSPGTAA